MNDEQNRPTVVDASKARVWRDAMGALHLRLEDQEFRDVRPVRVFPLSGKADYVSFLSKEDKEVALIGNLRGLEESTRRTLEEALERMYFTARITEILSITEIMGISRWQVMTDRGYASFEVVTREHIRDLGDGKFVIIDADGNRFEIPRVSQLDRRSQALVFSET